MALIIATGSNQGESLSYLAEAKNILAQKFELKGSSRIYKSKAVDYLNQPDFFNQVLEFSLPALTPEAAMEELLKIEKMMGRTRDIYRGPRTIDIDMVFWEMQVFNSEHLTLPHPRWLERSFVIRPLQELPFFQTIEKCFTIPKLFEIEAYPI